MGFVIIMFVGILFPLYLAASGKSQAGANVPMLMDECGKI